MKEFIEKLIGRLEEEIEGVIVKDTYTKGKHAGIRKAKVIITELAEEYKLFGNSEQVNLSENLTGWIACSERLPEENIKDCLVTLENGAVFQASYSQIGEEFRMICWHGIERFSEENRVIAWMPLPAPYQMV